MKYRLQIHKITYVPLVFEFSLQKKFGWEDSFFTCIVSNFFDILDIFEIFFDPSAPPGSNKKDLKKGMAEVGRPLLRV